MPNYLDTMRQIRELWSKQEFDQSLTLIHKLNVADQAKLLTTLSVQEQANFIKKLPEKHQVFEFLSIDQQLLLAQNLPQEEVVSLLNAMHSDDFIDLYKKLPSPRQKALEPFLSDTSKQELAQLSRYPEGTAGAMMTSNFMTLSPELNMDEALQAIRLVAQNLDTLYLVYIVDASHQLIGVISLRQIVQASPEQTIQEIMQTHVVTVYDDEDQEHVAKTLAEYDFIAVPVIDREQRLVGIVTYDDAMDIVEEETTEDFLKSSGVNPISELNLKTAPILTLFQKRVFWLVILVFGSLLSGIGISKFEDIIAQNIVLVFFLPLLVGSGGNAGSQSATLMVRALATGDVHFKDWFHLIGRETLVALCLGGTMAVAVSILGYIRGDMYIAIVLAISMMGIVLMGCLIGMSLPFILKKLNLDPASASAPLVTSICDATGVVVYLYIASQILF